MVDAVASSRYVRERSGTGIIKVGSVPAPAPVDPSPEAVWFNSPYFSGAESCEITLNDFGLEETYGKFRKWKACYGRNSPPCGVLVDLFV